MAYKDWKPTRWLELKMFTINHLQDDVWQGTATGYTTGQIISFTGTDGPEAIFEHMREILNANYDRPTIAKSAGSPPGARRTGTPTLPVSIAAARYQASIVRALANKKAAAKPANVRAPLAKAAPPTRYTPSGRKVPRYFSTNRGWIWTGPIIGNQPPQPSTPPPPAPPTPTEQQWNEYYECVMQREEWDRMNDTFVQYNDPDLRDSLTTEELVDLANWLDSGPPPEPVCTQPPAAPEPPGGWQQQERADGLRPEQR